MRNSKSSSVGETIYLCGMLREFFLDEAISEVGFGRGKFLVTLSVKSISTCVAPGTQAFRQIETHVGLLSVDEKSNSAAF